MNVGSLILAKGNMYRVIGTGPNHLDVIEYNGHTIEQKILSQIKDEWYRWNLVSGVGERLGELKHIASTSPTKVPQPVKSFAQIEHADSVVIKGVGYVITQDEPTNIPEKWTLPTCKVFNIGKGLLCLIKQKVTSLMDKPYACEMLLNGVTTKLKESDVWTIVSE
uniref:Uncharacterized protein n=1 Tax=viral metagenome TaxID=1070528 RepID=A0A6C0JT55_9ZZZZ